MTRYTIKHLIKSTILIALLLGDFAYAHKVIGISDGDTMTLLVDNAPLKIRLANIDAPEKKQAYGRTVALVFCNGIEANTEQVRRGFAWVYPQYNKDAALPALEQVARSAKVGLWNDDNPIAPWVFRKRK